MVACFAIIMGLLGLIFFYIGISMGWLYVRIPLHPLNQTFPDSVLCTQEFMGVVLGSAVVPIALCVCWKKANKWGCIVGSIAGFFAGLIAWLVTTSSLNGGSLTITVSISVCSKA